MTIQLQCNWKTGFYFSFHTSNKTTSHISNWQVSLAFKYMKQQLIIFGSQHLSNQGQSTY
ncbi:cellulose binding domain-containing protein [Gloeocapsopsis sp. IPPAS B-1203]|uniref:cellulose binding domain-containing protein n=1 Tax=Gloeocapsopsis sp. IPPAS B-1203 TaxID=2049454 RepID=UPI000C199DF0|nr:hypothetical protein CSQ79_06745 [Gloeocapsopsis sp. IPPAS B-1203]